MMTGKRKRRWRHHRGDWRCSTTDRVATMSTCRRRTAFSPSSPMASQTVLMPSTTSSSLRWTVGVSWSTTLAAVVAIWWHDRPCLFAELATWSRCASPLRDLVWYRGGYRCWRMTSSARATRRGKWCSRRRWWWRWWWCVWCRVCQWPLIELLPVHR